MDEPCPSETGPVSMNSDYNQPLGGNEVPRFSGIASMFRLAVGEIADSMDVALIGVPLDIGTSNRSGTRYGPRQIRSESVLVRPYGMATGAAPFEMLCSLPGCKRR